MKKSSVILFYLCVFLCSGCTLFKEKEELGEAITVTSPDGKVSATSIGEVKDGASSVQTSYLNKYKIYPNEEDLGSQIEEYNLPYINHIEYIENGVYAIIGYNRHMGYLFRNLWIIKCDKKKVSIASSLVMSSSFHHGFSIIRDTSANQIRAVVQLDRDFEKNRLYNDSFEKYEQSVGLYTCRINGEEVTGKPVDFTGKHTYVFVENHSMAPCETWELLLKY